MKLVRAYTQDTHHFFDQLGIFLGLFTTWAMGVRAQKCGQTPRFPQGKSICLQGNSNVSKMNWKYFPQDLLQYFIDQSWPASLEFYEYELSDNSRPSVEVPNLGKFANYLIMYTFLHYYESNKSAVESKYNKDFQNWPDIWNFGRIVRNAFAHGGRINFTNENALPVNWLSLSYSPSDNGLQIIENDISSVEMILLMEEMDKCL
ncbi:hypothetical protein MUO71_02385 [Candidatus Bathyarchaeota archaeon]|nr:hypothetical protein [Candidatus Bathyarchaeota archaeon]